MLISLNGYLQRYFYVLVTTKWKEIMIICHLFLSTKEEANIQIANVTIEISSTKEILGITINNEL